MSKEKKHTFEESTAEVISQSEQFIEGNKKTIIYVLIGVLVVIGALFAYKYAYKEPRIKKAKESIFVAEQYFAKDSFNLALNGNGVEAKGFLDVIDKYGSTPSGNVAQAYAGICYFKLGDYENAEKHLKKFKASDKMVSPTLTGLIGDCYVERDMPEQALKYFNDAAQKADNDVISPIYLKKAATVYKHLGQKDKALECYKTIKEKYYNSQEAADIDKYIQELSF